MVGVSVSMGATCKRVLYRLHVPWVYVSSVCWTVSCVRITWDVWDEWVSYTPYRLGCTHRACAGLCVWLERLRSAEQAEGLGNVAVSDLPPLYGKCYGPGTKPAHTFL